MERELVDHFLGSFCHLRAERSFAYGEVLSLLCTRCTAIYGGFLVTMIYGWAMSWKGSWSPKCRSTSVIVAGGALLALCGLQVLVQKLDPTWGGGNLGRVITGMGVGVALALISWASRDSFVAHRQSAWISLGFVLILVIHGLLTYGSFWYSSGTTVVGLMALYLQVNWQVLGSIWTHRPLWLRLCLLVAVVLAEWTFLYAVNVLKIHV